MITKLVIWLLAASMVGAETFEVTAYCACEKCCGKWSKYQKTASGATPKEGVTCAAPRRLPFGTVLQIQGVGRRVVQDRLAPRFDHRIDVFFQSHQKALEFGRRKLEVIIVSSPTAKQGTR